MLDVSSMFFSHTLSRAVVNNGLDEKEIYDTFSAVLGTEKEAIKLHKAVKYLKIGVSATFMLFVLSSVFMLLAGVDGEIVGNLKYVVMAFIVMAVVTILYMVWAITNHIIKSKKFEEVKELYGKREGVHESVYRTAVDFAYGTVSDRAVYRYIKQTLKDLIDNGYLGDESVTVRNYNIQDDLDRLEGQ